MVRGRFFFFFFLLYGFLLAAENVIRVGPLPDHLEPFIVSLIDSAHTRLWVAMYRLTSAPCVHALVRAKQRGVDVRVVLDRQVLGLPVYTAARRHFARVGITPWWGGVGNLMHHKWAVIDNRLVTGSANWTHAGLNKNHEVSFLCDNPLVVQRYVTHFIVLTRRISGLAALSPPSDGTVFFIPDHRKSLRSALGAAIDKARSRICIAMYAFTSKWCWQKIIAAAVRGVMVRLIMEQSQITTPAYVARAQRAGVKVKKYAFNGDVLHDKCVIIDDEMWLGSMNLTGVGTSSNEENILRMHEPLLVTKVATCFDRLFDSL